MTESGTAPRLGALRATYAARRPPWTGYVVGGVLLFGGGTPLLVALLVGGAGPLPVLAFSIGYAGYVWMLVDRVELARRGKGARLDLHERGAVVTLGGGNVHTFDWDTVRVHQDVLHSRKNGITTSSHVYTLIGTDGVACTIGDSRRTSSSRYAGVVTHVKGAEFAEPEQWGPAVVRAVGEAQLGRVLEEVANGRRLEFNTIALGLHGVEHKERTLPWDRVSELRVVNGRFHVKEEGRRSLAMDVPVSAIPNFPVFHTVAKRLHEATRRP
ncbi:DUF6585 family protein [Streptomyces cinereoruber]|uniref:DUF6585 family protein n=1 Tax=Streptomyces cinereoruber TaxID=67260 RepID=UPI003C2DF837